MTSKSDSILYAAGRWLLMILPALLFPLAASSQSVAVRTNLLYDAALVPTLGAEFSAGSDWSLGIDGSYIWIKQRARNRHWCLEGGDIYLRRWFGKDHDALRMMGQHLGIYAQMYTFQIQLCDSHGFISGNPGHDISSRPLWGAGVEYGYSMPIAKHFNLDFSLGLGYCHAIINRYGPIEKDALQTDPGSPYRLQRKYTRNWVGPTKAEVSLVWHFGPIGKGRSAQ